MDFARRETGPRLTREGGSGLHVMKLEGAARVELFITAVRKPGQSVMTVFRGLAELLREADARVISFDVYGMVGGSAAAEQLVAEMFGEVAWPVTWLAAGDECKGGLGGIQVWAISGIEVAPLVMDERVVGSVFEIEGLKHCRLGGVSAAVTKASRGGQAREVFERMEAALQMVGMEFTDVVRTWFFNADILEWYDEFNGVRDAFFKQRGVYNGLVPASTGVGKVESSGAALTGMLLAVRDEAGRRVATASASPLQCSALDYGSSFSRAVVLVISNCRRLFVSGTASITAEGETVHLDDVAGQIDLTLDVVAAILQTGGAVWDDVTRATAYFPTIADVTVFRERCARRGLGCLPAVCMESTICRKDLLFELELDALVVNVAN